MMWVVCFFSGTALYTSTRSAWISMEPWVMTTSPVNIAMFLFRSASWVAEVILMGCSESDCSAAAVPAARSPNAARRLTRSIWIDDCMAVPEKIVNSRSDVAVEAGAVVRVLVNVGVDNADIAPHVPVIEVIFKIV